MNAAYETSPQGASPGADLFVLLRGVLWRPWLVAGLTLVGTVLALLVAWLMPPVYQATARILVESQQIPDALARSTVTASAAERLAIIEQRLMTRSNLLDVAHRLELFADQPGLSPTERVEILRNQTQIDSISFNSNPRYRGPTQVSAFTITFAGDDARQSARVANEFVEMVLAQNLAVRTARATETHDFFRAELERLSEKISAQEAEIADFKTRNRDHLPGSLKLRLAELTGLRQQMGLRAQRISRIEAGMLTGPMQIQQTGTADPVPEQVAFDPMTTGQLSLLRDKQRLTQQRISTLQATIDRTTHVEMELNAKQRRHDLLQLQHKDALRKATEAATGERLENRRQAERFEVLETAQIPEAPVAPQRAFIAIGGGLASLSLAVLFAGLLEWLSRALRSSADCVRLLNVRPVIVIPPIATQREQGRARARRMVIGGCVVLGFGIAVWSIPFGQFTPTALEAELGERVIALRAQFPNFSMK